MFQRKNFEISFENLRLNEDYVNAKSQQNFSNSSFKTSDSKSSEIETSRNEESDKLQESKMSFIKLIKFYNENFIIISQKDKAAYLQLTLSDIIGFFSIPVCTKLDGRTKCKLNCDCSKSLDIGMQIYEKGGVQNFHQFGNIIIGCVIEQQTDPLTRVAIEFEKCSMKNIKRIYCPCKFTYCPHAFAVLYFRLKIQSFYAIKLPQELFDDSLEQAELIKFYGYIVEESRSLPLMCDYQTKEWSLENYKKYADVNSSMMYAYCHKSLLPVPVNIIEEQSRARKWISDLHSKRSISCNTFVPLNNHLIGSASEYSFGKIHKQPDPLGVINQNKHYIYKNNSNHGGSNGYMYKTQPNKNRNLKQNHA